MKFIVVGCGRVGAQLATRLFQQGHLVTVVDIVASAFNNLDPNFRGRTLEGDVLGQDMLRRAGVEGSDGLSAVTSSDTLNAVIGHIARTVFHVPNVVARNYDPRFTPLYEVFGIQTVAASTWGAQRIEELLCDASLRTVFSAGNGEVEVYELIVPASWHGHRLSDIINQNGCLPVAITRAGKAVLPASETVVEECDVLHVSATFEGFEALRQRLVASKEA
jgi:trk system potassium uptake protein